MNKTLFCFALILTLASLTVHLGTYIVKDYQSYYSYTFAMHGLILIFFGATAMQIVNNSKIKMPDSYIAYIILGICFIYVLINFCITLKLLAYLPRSVDIIDGKYVSYSNGKMLEITKKIYDKHEIYSLRLASGHWLFFSILPAVYYYYNDVEPVIENNEV